MRPLSLKEFEDLVEEALADLPAEFSERLVNVAIVLEEEPSEADLQLCDSDSELLGIFRGIPLTEWSHEALPTLPGEIAIFRGPILRVSASRAAAAQEIRETVIHELGHYFGLADDELPY